MDSSKNINFTICIVNYNKSQYLPFLFDSLLRQRDKNFCVLFVDNNSTDNSVEIAKNYAQKLRIEVLSEKKRGVQFARQAVLNNVKTEFFSFVDADDIVDCDYVSFINKNKAHCDLLIFGFKSFEDFNSFVKKNRPINPKIKTKIYQLKKPIYSFQKLMGIELTFLWNKVFRKSVCDHFSLSFDPEVSIGEDCLFIDKYLPHSSSIKVSDKLLYYYRKAEGSLMNYGKPSRETLDRFLSEIKRCNYMNSILNIKSHQYLEWLTHELWIYRNIYKLFIQINEIKNGNIFLNNYLETLTSRLKKNKCLSVVKLKLAIKLINKNSYFGIPPKISQKNR